MRKGLEKIKAFGRQRSKVNDGWQSSITTGGLSEHPGWVQLLAWEHVTHRFVPGAKETSLYPKPSNLD